jgi:hypothetical protein
MARDRTKINLDEEQIQELAESKHLPASTLMRSWILEGLDFKQAAR